MDVQVRILAVMFGKSAQTVEEWMEIDQLGLWRRDMGELPVSFHE